MTTLNMQMESSITHTQQSHTCVCVCVCKFYEELPEDATQIAEAEIL